MAVLPPSRNRTRRRRRSSSTQGSTLETQASQRAVEGESRLQEHTEPRTSASRAERPSSPKRQRLMSEEMRHDPDNLNANSTGSRFHGNGSSTSPSQKTKSSNFTNGHSYVLNGHSVTYTNGTTTGSAKLKRPTFFGHDREEVSRLLIQALNDLGYQESAEKLVHESGFELERPSVAAFRHAVLQGEWAEAESLLFGSHPPDEGGGVSINNGDGMYHEGLLLAEGVNKDELKFQLRVQKYLELLEERDLGGALMVLRQELTPLDQDIAQLHILSRYKQFKLTTWFRARAC